MKRSALCAAIAAFMLVTLLGIGSRNTAQANPGQFREPLLVGATVLFHTHDDDKDADTRLSMRLDAAGRSLGSIENITGRFPDHSHNGPFALRLMGHPSRYQMQHGALHLFIRPNGHDRWRFATSLQLRFSDGSCQNIEFQRIELSHDNPHGILNY